MKAEAQMQQEPTNQYLPTTAGAQGGPLGYTGGPTCACVPQAHVRHALTRIYRALGVTSRIELARMALRAGLGDTVRSRSLTGKPARMLRTPRTDEWERPDGPGPLPMPIQPLLIGDAMRRIHRVAATEGSGANELITYFVGQVVGTMNTVRPTRQVILEMVEEFVDTLDRLNGLVADE